MPHDVSDFDYALPPGLIADRPLPDRDRSRLLVLDRRTGRTAHAEFRGIVEHLRDGDLLVLNNARVVPARLHARKPTGGRVEVFLVRQCGGPDAPPWPVDGGPPADTWTALVAPSARLAPGMALSFPGSDLVCLLVSREQGGRWVVRFEGTADLAAELSRLGEPPLPPYIAKARRERGESERPDESDRACYQTVYASVPGAVAAPTAGLHFTPGLLDQLARQGIETAHLTLLVGPGTFRPVKAADYTAHVLDPEYYVFPGPARAAVQRAMAEGRRVVAVGTTSCRVLEYVAAGDLWDRETGWTDLYVYPPYDFRVVSAMVTNFHLPRSTLLMLVCAFAGRERVLAAYAEAVEHGYRFYSYGDAMLIV